MYLQQAAEELVRITSSLVSGRTINIMNTDGIIIASSDPDRVGTFHYGAEQVVRTGRSVLITQDQLPAYPGAREGCNMPLRKSGKIIGVVGIFGNPTEIQDLAHLLEVYASKYLELESIVVQRMEDARIRRKLYHLLTSEEAVSPEYIHSLSETISLQLQMPVLAISIRDPSAKTSPGDLEQILVQEQCLDRARDLSCLEEDCLMLLKSMGTISSDNCRKQLTDAFRKSNLSVRVTFGHLCMTSSELAASSQESRLLGSITCKDFEDADTPSGRSLLLMDASIKKQLPYFRQLYERLQQQFHPDELQTLLTCAELYYLEGRSVTKAAARLFIHKNTLQYRLHRLLEAMQLGGESGFYQEYLVRLILQYVRVYSGE